MPTPALSTAALAIAALSLLSLALDRQDLLILAAPLIVGTVLPLLTRAYRLPLLRAKLGSRTLLEGEFTSFTVEMVSTESLDVVRLRPSLVGRLDLPDGGRHFCRSLRGGQELAVAHRLEGTRWGRGRVSGIGLTATTAHGLLRADTSVQVDAGLRILPLRSAFTATDLVPDAAGIVGGHRSRRPGEGSDLAGLRPFVVGDRLRRINWPVSTRTGQLHVTATFSDRDTEVVLVLDTAVDLTGFGVTGEPDSTIGTAVRAAAAVAEHYLHSGDRVGLLDLSRAGRPIRSRTGRTQLNRLVDVLIEVKPASPSEQTLGRSLARISHQALVIVFSPLLAEELATAVANLSRTGRSVVVVDTLPARVELPEQTEWIDLAWRIQLLARQNLIHALAQHGVPVVPWRGSGSLDQVLAGLSRVATAPRARR